MPTSDPKNLTRDEAARRAGLLSIHAYAVDLDLTTGEETFGSRSVVTFSCREPGASSFIDLIGATTVSATLNGVALPSSSYDGVARLALPDLAAENELVVDATCTYMNTGEGLHRFIDPVDDEVYLYSQFEVADCRRVFAVFDQPDLKSRFTFTITAADHWTVISTSPSPEPEPAGEGRAVWRFEPTPVLPCYVTSVIAGPYQGVSSSLTSADGRTIPLRLLCRASLLEHLEAEEMFDVTRRGFEFFEATFGQPYPFAKYDQVIVPEFNAGAMENAGAVTFQEGYIFRGKVPEAVRERRAMTVLHELAHMWFGDLVTMKWWDDLWLNESFAEYSCTVALADATDWTGAWSTFASMHKSWAYRQDQLPSTHPVVASMNDLADVEVNFDGITYAKGASVLKQLVAWVGREQFEQGVRRYFATHAWGNTTLTDFLTQLEATSGRDLRAWSAAWLEKAGVTVLRPVVELHDETGVTTITRLAIEQTPPAIDPDQLPPHRLAIGGYRLDGEALTRDWRIELDIAGALTEVPDAVGKPMPDLLLINDDDLAYAKIRLDPQSLATAVAHLGAFADSLPRSLVWAAAWDMVRDSEMPMAQFESLVTANVAAETDSSVMLTVIRQLAAGVRSYLPSEQRGDVMARLGEEFRTLALRAPAGSDHQLQLVKAAASYAVSKPTRDWVTGLLDGDAVPDGLMVDTELRWEVLAGLAGGLPSDDEKAAANVAARIDAQSAADDTATGRLRAATARASIPTAANKRAVWDQVLDDASLPNALQGALIGGFGNVVDAELLRPFVTEYFDAIADVWEQRTNEMAQQIVVGLYPHAIADADVLAATDQWLDDHADAHPALRRLVLENRDGVRRALAVRDVNRAS